MNEQKDQLHLIQSSLAAKSLLHRIRNHGVNRANPKLSEFLSSMMIVIAIGFISLLSLDLSEAIDNSHRDSWCRKATSGLERILLQVHVRGGGGEEK